MQWVVTGMATLAIVLVAVLAFLIHGLGRGSIQAGFPRSLTSATQSPSPDVSPTASQSPSPSPSLSASVASPSAGSVSPSATASASAPAPRIGAALSFDGSTGKVLLFGGGNMQGDGTAYGDTWTWDGSRWASVRPDTSPPGRSFGLMAYDAQRHRTVLFGGGAPNSDAARNDTWTWDGRTWTEQHPATVPPSVTEANMAYDAAIGRVVLHGTTATHETGTWTWDGTTWTAVPGPQPPDRYQAAMAYDVANGQVILFGGSNQADSGLRDTWSFNGTTWQQAHPSTSPPSGSAFAAWDSRNSAVLLLTAGGETWTWASGAWSKRNSPTSPSPRAFAAIATDDATGTVVMFGGKVGNALSNATWTWNGSDWTRRT
jgi:hypothetical protein